MPGTFFLFGLTGYTATRLADALRADGWRVTGTTRDSFAGREADLAAATHILSSVPPGESDPVLDAYRDTLSVSRAWLGYLSSTGVYGDVQGAWVDESAPTGTGRRTARAAADAEWLALGARVFRLPGIYGPGRSPLDRIPAHRVVKPGQKFSRVHVDDIVSGVIAALDAPAGAYNLADDLPAPQHEVIGYACALLGRPLPPLVPIEQAQLSPAAQGFWRENRRVSNGKAKRLLGWRPRYPDYRLGLRALSATTSPTSTSNAPATASSDQR